MADRPSWNISNYQSAPCDIPEEQRPYLHHGRSRKSCRDYLPNRSLSVPKTQHHCENLVSPTHYPFCWFSVLFCKDKVARAWSCVYCCNQWDQPCSMWSLISSCGNIVVKLW